MAINNTASSVSENLRISPDANSRMVFESNASTVSYETKLSSPNVVSNSTADFLIRNFVFACAVGMSDVINKKIGPLDSSTRVSTSDIAVLSRLAELKSWLKQYRDIDVYDGYENEISQYAQHQIEKNFINFTSAIKELAPSASDTQMDALAQLLIASTDYVRDARSNLLGASIEPYLDSNEPLLIDAAAKALSRSRLDFLHAAKRMQKIASNTKFRYLKKQLEKVATQLIGDTDSNVRQEA